MVWADDDFYYFDWLNRFSKFGHGVVPDHVSFCGIFFFFKFGVRRFVPETIDIKSQVIFAFVFSWIGVFVCVFFINIR